MSSYELPHLRPNVNFMLSRADSSNPLLLARQVVQRLEVGVQHTEAGIAGIVLQRVPEGVHLLEDLACDSLPVRFGTGDRSGCEAEIGSSDRPSGFGDPDLGTTSTIHCIPCFLEVLTEGVEALLDADALPVGVTIVKVSTIG